jgi:pre-60S factor REI1
MSHAHSFFIPDAEYLIDVESLLGYLFVIISAFHECLFCGTSKSTKFGVQDHMRGKGHCKVDFEDDEHQLKEFYDFSGDVDGDAKELEEEVTVVPDEGELRLPSGKILGHRPHARYFRQNPSRRPSSPSSSRQQLLTEGESETAPTESKDRRVAMRAGTSTSMIGVPELQQRALAAVEKKILRMETTAKNEYQSILERGGNKQKSYRVVGMGKKQGGLEKRLG